MRWRLAPPLMGWHPPTGNPGSAPGCLHSHSGQFNLKANISSENFGGVGEGGGGLKNQTKGWP